MSTAQPISFISQNQYNQNTPSASFVGDFPMGSYNAAFNPASYTRKVMGSPYSWKAGSFGSRFYPGCSPGVLGPLDPTDLHCARMSSSIESDRGSLLNALNVMGREDEMCRDYSCCGLQLNDLHALVEHFEECHVVVWDPRSPYTVPSQQQPVYFPSQTGTFDPDDMELEFDHSSAPSSAMSTPPDTPAHMAATAYPSVSAFDTTTVLPSRSGLTVNPFPSASHQNNRTAEQHEVFTVYARAKEYEASFAHSEDHQCFASGDRSGCVTPALLLSSAATTPEHTPDGSRVNSPAPSSPSPTASSPTSPTGFSSIIPSALSRPATSLIITKPFRCPKPNCNKSYKQANGLKYHMTHGSCNFTPSKEGEVVKEGMSENEVREVERRLRPYACGVGDCTRRYKNMNGLRYHYQHSGEHGARGLTLLASGLHECLIGKRTTNTSVRQDHHQQQQSQPSMINHNTLPDLSQQNFYQPLQYHPHQQVTSQAQPVQQYNWGMMQS